MAEEQAVAKHNRRRDPLMKLLGIKECSEDVRNATLVVLVLVATASFQAVMSPPDHVTSSKNTARVIIFTAANVLAWSFAMTVIQMLMYSFPYRLLIKASCFSMSIAFALSAADLVNTTAADWYIGYIMYSACIVIPLLFRVVTLLVEKDDF